MSFLTHSGPPAPSQLPRSGRQVAGARQIRSRRGRPTPTGRPWLDELDRTASELGHELGPLRLAIGDALNALDTTHRYHELGFSSLSAYAVERSGKPKRWVAESRALAATLAQLTTLRRQLMAGRLSWTRAELLAKLVERSLTVLDVSNPDAARALQPAFELSWLFRGSGMTCRELGESLRSLAAEGPATSITQGMRWLTLTVPSEDTWWFHGAERAFRRIAERRDIDAFLEAILAETHNTLHDCQLVTREQEGLETRDRWRSQLDQWRTQAEHLCERTRQVRPRTLRAPSRRASTAQPAPDELRTWSALALDEHITSLAQRVHANAVALGSNAEQLHRLQAWRQFGFASPGHYARDRLGVSLSSLKQKRTLARRLLALPRLARALGQGQLGSVAASLVARIATSKTERRWVERARQRTVKHLREEVAFVERVVRTRPGHHGLPPSPEVMRAELALQGSVMSGRQFWLTPPRQYTNLITQQHRGGHHSGGHHSGGHHSGGHHSVDEREHLRRVRAYAMGVDASCSQQIHSQHIHSDPLNGHARSLPDSADRLPAAELLLPPGSREACADASFAWTTSTGASGQTSACRNSENSEIPRQCKAAAPERTPRLSPSNTIEPVCASPHRQCTAEVTDPGPTRTHVTSDGLSLGSVRLRLRVYECTLLLYHEVARAFARQHPTRPLLRSLCEHFLTIWGPVVARKPAHKYEHIYERDGYTCTSPVCARHDLTPHHLKFRSRGGGDEPENLASLCVWCHLEGVHGGRIRADPEPNGIRWTIGRAALTRVVDREKLVP